MALEITVRDLEKQEEISKMVCKCALLSMDETGEHGDARTIVFAECGALTIADSRIALMRQTVALYNQMQAQFGGQRLLEGNSIFGGGTSSGAQGRPGSVIDVDWTPIGEAGAEAFEQASNSAAEYRKSLKLTGERQSWFTDLMDDTFGRVVAKMALWQIMGNAISAMVNSLKDAVSTIKEVDSELANIEKVSGMSESELRKLEESAYDVASAYGVAVQDYLSAVATFSKAGYDDLAPMLGELAVKTQLVGDVNAEMASKMLLAVDAAYEMKGSQEQLTNVLDKMNYVENNYSTSIEKLTEGMPIVASTASQANMSIEELIATLGTITAVTQESGTKAATAWRSLILNLFGEIGAEIEEGEKVTEESVASLNDLMWKYARSAMEAAKATGTIVDPMEAIAALSQSMKEGSRILPATIVIVHVIGLYRVSVPIQTHKTPLFIVRKAHKAHTPVNIIRGFAQDHNVVRGGPRKGRPGRSHGEKVCRMGQHLTEFHNCTVFAHCYFLLVFLAGGRYNTDTGLPVVVGGSLHPALGGGDAEGFFFYLLAHYYITLSLYFNRHII